MKPRAVAVLAIAAIGAVIWLVVQRLEVTAPPGTLYGNVEIRQVDLSFNAEGTVAGILEIHRVGSDFDAEPTVARRVDGICHIAMFAGCQAPLIAALAESEPETLVAPREAAARCGPFAIA